RRAGAGAVRVLDEPARVRARVHDRGRRAGAASLLPPAAPAPGRGGRAAAQHRLAARAGEERLPTGGLQPAARQDPGAVGGPRARGDHGRGGGAAGMSPGGARRVRRVLAAGTVGVGVGVVGAVAVGVFAREAWWALLAPPRGEEPAPAGAASPARGAWRDHLGALRLPPGGL